MSYHSLQNKAPSPEYSAGHESTFGAKSERFCSACDRPKAWCECPPRTWSDRALEQLLSDVVTRREVKP